MERIYIIGLLVLFSCIQCVELAESPSSSYFDALTKAASTLTGGNGFSNGTISKFLFSPEILQLADALNKGNFLQTVTTLLSRYPNLQPMLQNLNSSSLRNLNSNALPFLLSQLSSSSGIGAGIIPGLGLSTQCLADAGQFLIGLFSRSQWALRMLDASAKIPTDLLDYNVDWSGSFDECVAISPSGNDANIRGQYCNMYMPISQQATFYIGLCVPDTCTERDLDTVIGLLNRTIEFDLNFKAKCQDNDKEFSNAAIAMLVVCGVFVAIMAIATLYDVTMVQKSQSTNQKSSAVTTQNGAGKNINGSTSNRATVANNLVPGHFSNGTKGDMSLENKPHNDTHPVDPPSYNFSIKQGTTEQNGKPEVIHGDITVMAMENGRDKNPEPASEAIESKISQTPTEETPIQYQYQAGSLGKILLSFSVYTNGKKLLDTKQASGTLTAINGIRFISMTWVILGHTYALGMQANVKNIAVLYTTLVKRVTFQAIINALVSVDTFFTLSGLLLTYLMMKAMEKNKGAKDWIKFWILYYFHRFWRLTPAYMLILGAYVALTPYFYDGPHYPDIFYYDFDACRDTWWTNILYVNNFVKPKKMCMAWSWYLANDMQFFVVSPLMLLPLCLLPIFGIIFTCAVLVGLIICTGVVGYQRQWPPTLYGGGGHLDPEMFYDYYMKPYFRAGPYIVGILTGYILFKTKRKVKIPWFLNLLGWAVATTLACLVLYGLHKPLNGEPLSDGVSALYLATHRTVWGACVCWVIFACATGNGGWINTFLSWKAFTPLARLTYCAYLFHPVIIAVYTYSLRVQQYWTDLTVIYLFLGHLVLSYMGAFVLSLAFESPMMGMEKVLLGGSKNKKN